MINKSKSPPDFDLYMYAFVCSQEEQAKFYEWTHNTAKKHDNYLEKGDVKEH